MTSKLVTDTTPFEIGIAPKRGRLPHPLVHLLPAWWREPRAHHRTLRVHEKMGGRDRLSRCEINPSYNRVKSEARWTLAVSRAFTDCHMSTNRDPLSTQPCRQALQRRIFTHTLHRQRPYEAASASDTSSYNAKLHQEQLSVYTVDY
jgi:hypothetical protein